MGTIHLRMRVDIQEPTRRAWAPVSQKRTAPLRLWERGLRPSALLSPGAPACSSAPVRSQSTAISGPSREAIEAQLHLARTNAERNDRRGKEKKRRRSTLATHAEIHEDVVADQ